MQKTVFLFATEAYPRNGEGSLCRLRNNRLIFCYTRFHGGTDDDDESSIWVSESRDTGKSWSQPVLLLENRGALNTMSVSIAEVENQILMVVLAKDSPSRSRLECFELAAPTFDEPRYIGAFAPNTYMGFHNDRLRVLQDQRLVIPVSFCENSGVRARGRSKSLDFSSPRTSALLFSSDFGRSWELDEHRIKLPKRGAMEPCITEYGNGNLLVTLRTQLGSIYQTRYSSNRWTEPSTLGIESPEAPHTLVMDPYSGVMYLVHCPKFVDNVHHFGLRYPLVMRSSSDSGETWSAPLTIVSGRNDTTGEEGAFEYANASVLCTETELFLTFYRRHLDSEDYNRKDLMIARIPKEEIPLP